jgi:truncated hemoglobin YjbI
MSSIHYITKTENDVFQIVDKLNKVIAKGEQLALTPCMDEFYDEVENYESYQSVHESDLLSLYENKTPVYLEKVLGKPSFIGGKVIIYWAT